MHYFLCLYVLLYVTPDPRSLISEPACFGIVTITELHDVNSCIPGLAVYSIPIATPFYSVTSTHWGYDNGNTKKNNGIVKTKCTWRPFAMLVIWPRKIEVHMP